ncbi:hypothetical protein TNCV_4658231 [Trichonephila clavipes]|nr:hypothetical protein TNCV_4658231 [Trichonephila clavipes]
MRIGSGLSSSPYWPIPCEGLWGVVGYTSRLHLIRIDVISNSASFFSGVLRAVCLTFIPVQLITTIQQDNAQPHHTGILRTFLDTKNDQMLPSLHFHQILSQYNKYDPHGCQATVSSPYISYYG